MSKQQKLAIAFHPLEKKELSESQKTLHKDLHIFSLKQNKVIRKLGCKEQIISVLCSGHCIVAATLKNIYCFDPITPDHVQKLRTFPVMPKAEGPTTAPMSLSRRWLAYPGNEDVPNNTFSQTTTDKIVGITKDAKDVLYSIGSKTISTVSDYYASKGTQNQEGSTSPPKPMPSQLIPQMPPPTEHAGTIIVYDVVAKKKVAHFQAHILPIQFLKFDPTGTLLATASQDGQNFNVFKIKPNNQPDSPQFAHLYRLTRSFYTSAQIQVLFLFSTSLIT